MEEIQMIAFILLMAIANMLGGRWKLIAPGNGRLLWRCILPGIFAGALAFGRCDLATSFYVWFAVTAGSALWYPWGWSFEEMGSPPDLTKYPAWVRWIGYEISPYSPESPNRDKIRGAIMKGIRGGFDILTFALLYPLNHLSPLLWLGTFAQGAIYYLTAKLVKSDKNVLVAELFHGAWRGFLIGACIWL